ncbi:hypothetical protein [Streptomyces sp. NRRL S-813]|uniref:hypothetical protein n=1 Tax=Streptomyces sp. NRRL S-813 TaxID=1463919 RepID=UPI0004BF3B27|nr:hypothetical protein [Streptomyces sp. NRRL S-813]
MPAELHDEHHDPFEERFADALRDTGTTFATDQQELAAGGQARGRRLRARRRAAVAGGVAAVALIGVGGALVLPGVQGDGGRQRSVAEGPSSGRTDSAASGSAGSGASGVSGDELLRTFEKLLPKGKLSDTTGRGTADNPFVQGVYDDGRGKAAIALSLGLVPARSQEAAQTTECPDRVYIAYDSCTSTKLSDGSALMILKGYEYPNKRSGTKLWRAELVTPTGAHVSAQEWNAAAEKDSPVTRTEPPLSPEQLKKLVTAPEWRAAAGAIPVDPRTTAAPSATPTHHGSIPATLARLIPNGVKVVSHSRSEDYEFGYVVVDDGRGRTLVQINVQPDMRDVEGELFGAGTRTLPDGTKVVRRKQDGEKGIAGIVMWTVDTIRPDGRRVVISAFNSGAQNTPATRQAPALTMKQLEAIATDQKWLKIG